MTLVERQGVGGLLNTKMGYSNLLLGRVNMEKHYYTVRWTQPYATEYLRPYLRDMQKQLEDNIESYLEESKNYADAQALIERIKKL